MPLKRRAGRPVATNPRNKAVNIKFTASEYEEIKDYADFNNITVTTALRKLAFGALKQRMEFII